MALIPLKGTVKMKVDLLQLSMVICHMVAFSILGTPNKTILTGKKPTHLS